MIKEFKGGKVEVSRFKGLGEMSPHQLKETTMNPKTRIFEQVSLDDVITANQLVDDLMGKKPEKRFIFIQNNARFVKDLDV